MNFQMYKFILVLFSSLALVVYLHGSMANWISVYQIYLQNATEYLLQLQKNASLPKVVRTTSLDVEFEAGIIRGRWFINRTTHPGRISLQVSSFYGAQVGNTFPVNIDSGNFRSDNVIMNHVYQITLWQRTQMGSREIVHKFVYTTSIHISQTSASLKISWNPLVLRAFDYLILRLTVPNWTSESFIMAGNVTEFIKPDVPPCTKYSISLKGGNATVSYMLGRQTFQMASSTDHKCLEFEPINVTARAGDDELDIYWPPSALSELTQWGLTISSDSRTDHVELFRRPAVYRHRIRPNAHGMVYLLGRFSGVYYNLGMAEF